MELNISNELIAEHKSSNHALRNNLLAAVGTIGLAALGYTGALESVYSALDLTQQTLNLITVLGGSYLVYRGFCPSTTIEESIMVMPVSESNYGLIGLRKQQRKFNPESGYVDTYARPMLIQRDMADGESIHNQSRVKETLNDAIVGAVDIKPQNDYTVCHMSVIDPLNTDGTPVRKTVLRRIPLLGFEIQTPNVRVTEKRYHVMQVTPDIRYLDPEVCPSGIELEPNSDWSNFQIAFPLEYAEEISKLVTTPNYEKHLLHTHLFKLMQEYGKDCKPKPGRDIYITEHKKGKRPEHHKVKNREDIIRFLEEQGIYLNGLDQEPPEKPTATKQTGLAHTLTGIASNIAKAIQPLINFN